MCLAAERQASAGGTAAKKVIFWWVPEGAAQQAFWPAHGPGPLTINPAASVGGNNTPRSEGQRIDNYRSAEMGTYCLQPLSAFVDDLTIISGISNEGAPGFSDDHMQVVSGGLTGNTPDDGSLDQILGFELQGNAPFHAIFSSLYGEHVGAGNAGYLSPFRTTSGGTASLTWNPVTTFNQVFPSGLDGDLSAGPDKRLISRFEGLGKVRRRLERVRCEAGSAAQHRMAAYLASIEQVEQQTEALIESGDITADVTVDIPPGWTEISDENRYWRDPMNFGTLAKIQIDTTVAALATNRTRVSLLQFSATGNSNGISGTHYRNVGIQGLENDDVVDHHLGHGSEPVRRRNQARIFRWYYTQLAYLIERLKAIPDVDGNTLFDNTLIVTTSDFGMYDHRRNDLPYMLIGNPTGQFRTGQYIDAYQGGFRSHADFLLGVAHGLGVELEAFGTSTTPYTAMLY